MMTQQLHVQSKVQDIEALNQQLMRELYQARLLNQTLTRILQETAQEESSNGKGPLPEQEVSQEVKGGL
jgi:hypothetical protein